MLIGAFRKLSRLYLPIRERVNESIQRKACECGAGVRLYESCIVYNGKERSAVVVGENSHVRGQLNLFPNGKHIRVGRFCYIGDQTRIWAMKSIDIGDRVLISHGVNIHDNNAHSLSAMERHEHFIEIFTNGHPSALDSVSTAAIHIEDDVWIGFNATILKGVRIGRGAVVGAGSVVTKDVPPFSIVVGNPARIVGTSYE